MKNKNIIYIGILLLLLVALVFVFFMVNKKEEVSDNGIADGMYKVEYKFGEDSVDVSLPSVFTNYDDFSGYFKSSEINKDSFKENNYAVITLTYDECKYTNVVPSEYTVNENILDVVAYHDGCSACKPKYAYYVAKIEKSLKNVDVHVNWIARDVSDCQTEKDYS